MSLVLTRIAEQHDAKVLRRGVVLMDNAQEATEPQADVMASFFLAVGMIACEFATQGRELLPIVTEAAPERGRLEAAMSASGTNQTGIRPSGSTAGGGTRRGWLTTTGP